MPYTLIPHAAPWEIPWSMPQGPSTTSVSVRALVAKGLRVSPALPSSQITGQTQQVAADSSILFYLGEPDAPGSGVTDVLADEAVATADVSLTVTDSNGTPVAGLTAVSMDPVTGANGDYALSVVSPGLVTNMKYRAVATITSESYTVRVVAVFQPVDYYGSEAAP